MTLTGEGAKGDTYVASPSIRATSALSGRGGGALGTRWSPVLLLVPLYVLAVALLFASHVREFADETDNLLGGLLIARGARLYVDFFSSHMPLAYYVAALPALFGVASLEQFRVLTDTLLIVAMLGVVWGFRHTVPVLVLGGWAVLSVYAHTLQFGEMLTAGTLAGYGVLVAGLLFYTTPRLEFSPRQIVVLSGAVFVAAQSELVAVFPLLFLGVCFVAVRISQATRTSIARELRATLVLLAAIVAPNALVLIGFWLTGILGEFGYDAYQFNQVYYSQFLMNSSVSGILHDWEAQYRTYLVESLRDPLGVQGCLVLANLFAAWLVSRSRGVAVGVSYYVFVALSHVRNEWAYYLCSYFSLALAFAWAATGLAARRTPWSPRWTLLPVAVLLLMAVFAIQVGFTYDLSGRAPRESTDTDIIRALTAPGDEIFVAPFDPYMYLATGRMPASSLTFYFPWQAIDPRMQTRLFNDLSARRPPLVLFRRYEVLNGHWQLSDYGQGLYDFLLSQDYAPLDASSPVLGDVLVPRDRLAAGRQRLGL